MNIFTMPWYIWYPLSLVLGLVGFVGIVMMVAGLEYWWDMVFV